MAIIERCGNCAFWINGDCRKRAPIVLDGIERIDMIPVGNGPLCSMKEIRGPQTHWPKVEPNQFCGEWELKG